MNSIYFIAIVLSVAAAALGSPTKQCPGESFEGLKERISITPCGKTKCRLPKGQNVTVVVKFKPEKTIETLNNKVNAEIGGIPLPFIGVDGTSACNNINHAEDKTPAPCPLEANKEYEYTNVFHIYTIYPELPMKVHWSLDDGKTTVICFEIPVEIVKSKSKSHN